MLVFPPSDFSSLDGDSFFFFFSTSCEIEQQECNEETSITINMCTSNTARVIGVCVLKKFSISLPSGRCTPRSTPTSVGQVGSSALFPKTHSSNKRLQI